MSATGHLPNCSHIIFNNGNYMELPGLQGAEICGLISPNYRPWLIYTVTCQHNPTLGYCRGPTSISMYDCGEGFAMTLSARTLPTSPLPGPAEICDRISPYDWIQFPTSYWTVQMRSDENINSINLIIYIITEFRIRDHIRRVRY